MTSETRGSADVRDRLPVLGLREYWYPAVLEKEVGWGEPVLVRLLGQDLCFFRGASGKVVALDNACPHRGAKFSAGHCDFKGTLTCFYHGMTFDETGLCVAALGEGPESPMPGKLRAKTYPTQTAKGVVFVWMGAREPVPLTDDAPDEFFDPSSMVFNWTSNWTSNWRPAVENYADSHVRYVHRNSVLMLMRPILPPALPLRGRPVRVGAHRLAAPGRGGDVKQARSGKGRPYQDYYPLLDATWPKHRWRFLWTWLFALADRVRRQFRTPFQASPEWDMGQHLPSIVRINYGTHMYTRWAVPVDEEHTRMFYFHSARRPTWLGRLHERLQWHLFHNWAMNKNFSEQDAPGSVELYYDRPERLSVSDQQTVQWRRMVLAARGMPRSAGVEPEEDDPAPSDASLVLAGSNGAQSLPQEHAALSQCRLGPQALRGTVRRRPRSLEPPHGGGS
jgi:phenylpropionate dioxygenase-like ring-hydroxylating dioxygenase large terminal subunit